MDKRVYISVIGVACLLGSDICAMNDKAALAKLKKAVSLGEDCVRQAMKNETEINKTELLELLHLRTDDTSSLEVSKDVMKARADFSVYTTQDAKDTLAVDDHGSPNESDSTKFAFPANDMASWKVADENAKNAPMSLLETLMKAIDQK